MAMITINGITLDPATQKSALKAAKLASANAHDSDYLFVQTNGPLTGSERAALEKTGAKILEFVPQDTYVCGSTGTDLKKIRALPFVTSVNTYLRGFKIHPALMRMPESAARPSLLAVRGAADTLDRTPSRVDIVLHRGANTAAVRRKVAEATGVDMDDVEVTGNKSGCA